MPLRQPLEVRTEHGTFHLEQALPCIHEASGLLALSRPVTDCAVGSHVQPATDVRFLSTYIATLPSDARAALARYAPHVLCRPDAIQRMAERPRWEALWASLTDAGCPRALVQHVAGDPLLSRHVKLILVAAQLLSSEPGEWLRASGATVPGGEQQQRQWQLYDHLLYGFFVQADPVRDPIQLLDIRNPGCVVPPPLPVGALQLLEPDAELAGPSNGKGTAYRTAPRRRDAAPAGATRWEWQADAEAQGVWDGVTGLPLTHANVVRCDLGHISNCCSVPFTYLSHSIEACRTARSRKASAKRLRHGINIAAAAAPPPPTPASTAPRLQQLAASKQLFVVALCPNRGACEQYGCVRHIGSSADQGAGGAAWDAGAVWEARQQGPPHRLAIKDVWRKGSAAAEGSVSVGAGVYADEGIPPWTVLGDYVGELIDGEEAARRGEVYEALGLNYLFDLPRPLSSAPGEQNTAAGKRGYRTVGKRAAPARVAAASKSSEVFIRPRSKIGTGGGSSLKKRRRARCQAARGGSGDGGAGAGGAAGAIDATFGGNWTRFINHSCDPNCEAARMCCYPEDGQDVDQWSHYVVPIRTARHLRRGEELTIDYDAGTIGRREVKKWTGAELAASPNRIKCCCGAACCREWILVNAIDDDGED